MIRTSHHYSLELNELVAVCACQAMYWDQRPLLCLPLSKQGKLIYWGKPDLYMAYTVNAVRRRSAVSTHTLALPRAHTQTHHTRCPFYSMVLFLKDAWHKIVQLYSSQDDSQVYTQAIAYLLSFSDPRPVTIRMHDSLKQLSWITKTDTRLFYKTDQWFLTQSDTIHLLCGHLRCE